MAKEGGVKAVEKQRDRELRDFKVLNLASMCAKDFIIDFVLFVLFQKCFEINSAFF